MREISDSDLKFDIRAYLDKTGLRYVESGSQINIECPDCYSNKLYINLHNKLFICFKCGMKGKLYGLLLLLNNGDKDKVNKLIYNSGALPRFGTLMDLAMLKDNTIQDDEIVLEEDLDSFSVPIDDLLEDNLINVYLADRGITGEMVKNFNLRYAPQMRRLVFPVYDKGSYIGWIGRDITGTHKLKYYNHAGLKKQQLLYSCHDIDEVESIVLVEGPIDALKSYHHYGFAMMGKFLSKAQRNLLLGAPKLKRIYLGLDPDAAEDAYRISKSLEKFFEVYFVNYPTGYTGDIGDMDSEFVDQIINDAFQFRSKTKFKLNIGDS